MAIYEYYCPTCRTRFEERRPMSMATSVATCEQGHEASRTVSSFAAPRSSEGQPFEMDMGSGGGCCGGGGCGCSAGFQN